MNMTPDEMRQLAQIQAMISSFRETAGYDAVEQLASFLEETAATFQEELEAWEDDEAA
jgi:DNA-directed RNA polymerase sigma subunit (sigma70/sigma32)